MRRFIPHKPASQNDHENGQKPASTRRSSMTNGSNLLNNLKRIRKFENTYQMEPSTGKPNRKTIKLLMSAILKRKCSKETFSSFTRESGNLSRLTNEMHRAIKAETPGRYRFIVQICCLEDLKQDLSIASSFLWSKDFDNLVTVTFRKDSFVLVSSCHFVYIE